jgi:hypothetical protein
MADEREALRGIEANTKSAKMRKGGFEPTTSKSQLPSAAKVRKPSSAVDTIFDTTIPEKEHVLSALSQIWDDLPDVIKAALTAMVKTACAEDGQSPYKRS